MTTGELDALAAENIRAAGAKPSFLGYGHPPFPATICVSVNDEIVHGIPGDRVIAEGDIVSIDCGAIVDGWHGDAAVTVAVGQVPDEALELMRVTEESMWRGIAAATLGGHVGDISHAVQSYVRSQGDFGIVEDYTGHGIGSAMHQPPNVPNVGRPGPRHPPGRGPGAGRRADDRGRGALEPHARRRLDRRHRGRLAGRALREHLHARRRAAPGC